MLPYQRGVFDGLATLFLYIPFFIPILRFVATKDGMETTLIVHYAKNRKKYRKSNSNYVETVRTFLDRESDVEKLLEADITHTGLRTFHVVYFKNVEGKWNADKVPILTHREFVKEEDIDMDRDCFKTIELIRNHIAKTLNEIDTFPLGEDGLSYEPELREAEQSIITQKIHKFKIALACAYSIIEQKVMSEKLSEIMVFGGHTYLFELDGEFKAPSNDEESKYLGIESKLQVPMIKDVGGTDVIPEKEKLKMLANAIQCRLDSEEDPKFEKELIGHKIWIEWPYADGSGTTEVEAVVTKYDSKTKCHFVKFVEEASSGDEDDEQLGEDETFNLPAQYLDLTEYEWGLVGYCKDDIPAPVMVKAATPTDAMIITRIVDPDERDYNEHYCAGTISASVFATSLECLKNEKNSICIDCTWSPPIDTWVNISNKEADDVNNIMLILSEPECQVIGLIQHALMYDKAPELKASVVRNPPGAGVKRKVAIVEQTDDEEQSSPEDASQTLDYKTPVTNYRTLDKDGKPVWKVRPEQVTVFDRSFDENEKLEKAFDEKPSEDFTLNAVAPMLMDAKEQAPKFLLPSIKDDEGDVFAMGIEFTSLDGTKVVFKPTDKEDADPDTNKEAAEPNAKRITFSADVSKTKVESNTKGKRTIIPIVVEKNAATESIKKKPRRTLQGAANFDNSKLNKFADQGAVNFDYSKLSEFADDYIKATKEAAAGKAKKPKIAGDEEEPKGKKSATAGDEEKPKGKVIIIDD